MDPGYDQLDSVVAGTALNRTDFSAGTCVGIVLFYWVMREETKALDMAQPA